MRTLPFFVALSVASATAGCDVEALPEAASPDAAMPSPSPTPTEPPPPCAMGDVTLRVATLVGCSAAGTVDGPRAAARFANPVNVVFANAGALYVADFDNHRVRRVSMAGEVTTIIDGAKMPAGTAFKLPFGLALAPDGTLYIETDDNPRGEHSTQTGTIWRWREGMTVPQVVVQDIGRPRGMVVMPDGAIIVADHMHHTLSRIVPATKQVSVIAGSFNEDGEASGTGAEARFAEPYHLARLPNGDLLVSELHGNRIRRVAFTNGTYAPANVLVSPFAGSGIAGQTDGPALQAQIAAPQSLAVATDGAVYVTALGSYTIRRIKDGQVTTIAGDGQPGFADHQDLRKARFYGLEGMTISPDGKRLYVADGTRGQDQLPYHRIRIVNLP